MLEIFVIIVHFTKSAFVTESEGLPKQKAKNI